METEMEKKKAFNCIKQIQPHKTNGFNSCFGQKMLPLNNQHTVGENYIGAP